MGRFVALRRRAAVTVIRHLWAWIPPSPAMRGEDTGLIVG